jgi:hypothetical protein
VGVHYPTPEAGSSITSLAIFDGESSEPKGTRFNQVHDPTDPFVDMNGNGIRDQRETVTEAWRRLALLGADEQFTSELYRARVSEAARRLAQQGLLPEDTIEWHRQQADEYLEEADLA